MATLAVADVTLAQCTLPPGTQYSPAPGDAPTIHYGLSGTCFMVFDHEPPIRLTPHTLVVAPADKSLSVIAPNEGDVAAAGSKRLGVVSFAVAPAAESPGNGATFVSGRFRAAYGAALDLFASMTSPIVEAFDQHDQLDKVMGYAMAELAGGEPGGGAMSQALLKLVLFTLLRRSLTSTNPWVERFAILNDPPIARAFAQMASRPSDPHTAQNLSQAVGLSRSTFMARFRSTLGDSPMSVLRRLRMRVAAELLSANAQSVDQVALSVGYRSRSSFTRAFRRHYGSDPSEHRSSSQQSAVLEASEWKGGPAAPPEWSAIIDGPHSSGARARQPTD